MRRKAAPSGLTPYRARARPFGFAVFGYKGDTQFRVLRLLGVIDRNRCSAHNASPLSALKKAKQSLQDIALPLSVKPAKAGDLPFAQDDRHILQIIRPAEPVKAQHFFCLCIWRRFWGKQVINALANHLADDCTVVVGAIVEGFDMRAIAENRNAVGKALDLMKPVRNEQHADTRTC